jgi:hypothetical protein
MADQSIGPLRPISSAANDTIAKRIVARLLAYRTVTALDLTWRAYAESEIRMACDAASRPG